MTTNSRQQETLARILCFDLFTRNAVIITKLSNFHSSCVSLRFSENLFLVYLNKPLILESRNEVESRTLVSLISGVSKVIYNKKKNMSDVPFIDKWAGEEVDERKGSKVHSRNSRNDTRCIFQRVFMPKASSSWSIF